MEGTSSRRASRSTSSVDGSILHEAEDLGNREKAKSDPGEGDERSHNVLLARDSSKGTHGPLILLSVSVPLILSTMKIIHVQ